MADRRNNLIELLEALQDKQAWIWSMMDDDLRNQIGSVEDWAPKDHLAHANYWTERVIAQLKIALGEQNLDRLDDFKKTNEETFESFKELAWQEIHLWSEQVHVQLVDALSKFSTEILDDPERFEWTNHRPLWNEVVFTAVYHRVQHACDILNLCGMAETVSGVQEQFSQMMEQMDDSDRWRGTTKYNLACYYALDGKLDIAIETLKDALKLNPELLTWSKQDNDLDSLRDLSAFQSLMDR
jgi:tetratricopeptide (TPR) repeat protein